MREHNHLPHICFTPAWALLGILAFGMFVVGYDQGQLAQALFVPMEIHLNHNQLMMIHEFNHDLRHAAGFPCH
ncbi:MAG: hypothetical protein WCF03_05275 [Nitrososphaeraceae archaeon]